MSLGNLRLSQVLAFVALALVATACSDELPPVPDSGSPDTSVADAGVDGSKSDAPQADAGSDGGGRDAPVSDAAVVDGLLDAGRLDSAIADQAIADALVVDTQAVDAPVPDSTVDSAVVDAAPPDCAGVSGGTATRDGCGRCVGGTTGLTACPTVTITAEADAHVVKSAASTNYGNSQTLTIEADSRSNAARIFLRFDLSSLPRNAVVRKVTLRMHAYRGFAWGGDGNVYTQFVAADNWAEGKINWTNQPKTDGKNLGHWWLWYNSTPADKVGENSDPKLIIAVQRENWGDGKISFRLHSPGYRTEYRSREYATRSRRPTLVVGYEVGSITTLTPEADTYAASSAPTANYGKVTEMRVDRSLWRSFVRFDLGALPANAVVARAQLSMYAHSGFAWGGDGNVYIHKCGSDTWGETTLNWGNQPRVDATPLGFWWLWFNSATGPQWGRTSTDALTAAVNTEAAGDNKISFRLHSPGYRTYYRTREHGTAAQRPQLEILHAPPKAP